jgi:hypothetical protein
VRGLPSDLAAQRGEIIDLAGAIEAGADDAVVLVVTVLGLEGVAREAYTPLARPMTICGASS